MATLALPAQADYDPSQYPPYETCALCHGLFGVSHTAKFPNLAGQKPAYIEAQIRAFRAGTRTNDGGQMASIAGELEPEAIAVVVEWFAAQEPPEPAEAPETSAGQQAFADLQCADCHDNSATSASAAPYLTAQHAGYLQKQMADFRDGRREAPDHPGMHESLLALPDAQFVQIAAYLASQARQ